MSVMVEKEVEINEKDLLDQRQKETRNLSRSVGAGPKKDNI